VKAAQHEKSKPFEKPNQRRENKFKEDLDQESSQEREANNVLEKSFRINGRRAQ
jgi:hypothetical protein